MKTKTKNTEQRVVLNLSMDQAKQLNEYFMTHGGTPTMLKLQQRVEKTITKHETSKTCKQCGGPSDGTYCTYECCAQDEKQHEQEIGHELARVMGVTGPEGA